MKPLLNPPPAGSLLRTDLGLSSGLFDAWLCREGAGQRMCGVLGHDFVSRSASNRWVGDGQLVYYNSPWRCVMPYGYSPPEFTVSIEMGSSPQAGRNYVTLTDAATGSVTFWTLRAHPTNPGTGLSLYTNRATLSTAQGIMTPAYAVHRVTAVCSLTTLEVWVDGQRRAFWETDATPDYTDPALYLDIARGNSNYQLMFNLKLWNRALSEAEIIADHEDPYALIRPKARSLYVPASGSAVVQRLAIPRMSFGRLVG